MSKQAPQHAMSRRKEPAVISHAHYMLGAFHTLVGIGGALE